MKTILGILAVTLLVGTTTGFAQDTPRGDVANGKKLFETIGCFECHGYAGQGGAGARLAPGVLSAANFLKYVRQPAGAMPPYTSKVATDAELNDIRAYLATMPAPPPLKSIPILNQ
jgi:mono/diheme cytochrome c family protein